MSAPDFPWQKPLRERMRRALLQQRMPHALLLEGPEGLGKRPFAGWVSLLVLCEAPAAETETRPCGKCRSCRWIAAGTHPDAFDLQPEEDKKWIAIEQVRELVEKLSLKSFARKGKVAVIWPASSLTSNAANSLLKTLEEPTSGTLLMLITSRPARLPATIRSRCQRLRFTVPPPAEASAWLTAQNEGTDWPRLLELGGGAPLAALALHEAGFAELDGSFRADLEALILRRQDPLSVAGRWSHCTPETCLGWLENCTRRLIIGRFSAVGEPAGAGLQKAAKSLKLQRLFLYLDQVNAARAALDSPLNWQLALESLLIPWSDELRPLEENPIFG
ncbi:MAG: DNA polymerase III subunit delta' [Gammaproteobacteria bacterium]|nr:DNA polymerase III subunit delta' [Gammaproteobacteria bacterium]